jgi:hypothetical protein
LTKLGGPPIKQIGLALSLALGLLVPPLAAPAQPGKKVPRIGVFVPAEPSATDPVLERFRFALRGLGYVEGRDIAVEYVYAPPRSGILCHQKV